jgi:predicted phosphate transport protein (TIGR00153 family)
MASFAGLFGGRNPLLGLMKHMPLVHECAQQVNPLCAALIKDDRDELKAVAKKIFELEEQCDQIKHEVRAGLPRSLFLPVDRRDVLEVLHFQDSIADTAQDIAGLLLERNMRVPEHMAEPLEIFVERCVEVVGLAAEIVSQFDELLEVGFKGPEVEEMEGKINRLNEAEDGTDDLGIALVRSLFAHEDEMKPVSVMMWYRLIEWIGDLADYAEKVANRVRLFIAS